jgi:hypothetical protein
VIPAEGTSVPQSADSATGRQATRADAARRDAAGRDSIGRDGAGLVFVGEMYGVQLDHLAAVLGLGEPRARAIAARWRARRYAESARLGPGGPWTWLTRAGLAACGLPYAPVPPALARLAHVRAVVAVRLALESSPRYAAAGGYWRSERRLRARMGGRVGLREHVPDGEVHWPDDAPVAWAGECWAIEAELTRKTASRTTAIMRELLTRTGDYGCPAAEVRVPGRLPRHARAIYLCAPAARATVSRARDALGSAGARIEIRSLPPGAAMAPPVRREAPPARRKGPSARREAPPTGREPPPARREAPP